MKKIIFILSLLFTCLVFSNPIFDSLSGPRWTCANLADGKLVFLVISRKTENRYTATLNIFHNISGDSAQNVDVAELNLSINENEQYFYFTNLKKDAQKFSNYRFPYKIGKKNKVKFSLYDVSKKRSICDFSAR